MIRRDAGSLFRLDVRDGLLEEKLVALQEHFSGSMMSSLWSFGAFSLSLLVSQKGGLIGLQAVLVAVLHRAAAQRAALKQRNATARTRPEFEGVAGGDLSAKRTL